MNKTFEKAFYELSDDEQKTIIRVYGGGKDSVDFQKITEKENDQTGELLSEALMKLFILLRERTEGDLKDLSSFEETVLKHAVAVANADTANYR